MMPRGRVWRWVPSLLALALLAVFADAIPWRTVGDALRGASAPPVVAAALCTLMAVGARAALFWRTARAAGAMSFGLAVRATVMAVALNAVLIGQVGEAGRVFVARRGSSLGTVNIVAAVVFEHAAVSAVYLMVVLAATLVMPVSPELEQWRVPALLGIVLLGVAFLAIGRTGGAGGLGHTGRSGGSFRRVRCALQRFRVAFRRLVSGGRLGGALCLAAAHWALQFAAFYAIVRALGNAVPWDAAVVAFLALTASGSVRVTPGNLGVAQAVFAGTASIYGVPLSASVAVAVLWQAVQTVPIVLAAACLAAGAGAGLGSVRFPRSPWAARRGSSPDARSGALRP